MADAETKTLRVGVLASGTGSNFVAIADAIDRGEVPARIVTLISNRAEAAVLRKAQARKIPNSILDHRDYPSRHEYDQALAKALQDADVELVVLAGFDRLVTTQLLERFPDRVINIHPALLPSFKGLHAQQQASDYGVRISGATVHFVDEGLDHGPIILQAAVEADPFEEPGVLADRILRQEHRIYPMAVRLFAEGRLQIDGRRVRILGANAAGEATIIGPNSDL